MVNLQQYTQRSEVGAIKPWGKSTAPDGYVLCDGASLARAGTYADLFAVIGTTYGTADGSSFNVPDLQGKMPQGYDGGSSYDLADTGGANTVTVSVTDNQSVSSTDTLAVSVTGSISNTSLSTAQLASHTHRLYQQSDILYNAARAQSGGYTPGTYVDTDPAGSGTGHTHSHTLAGSLTGNITTSLTGAVTASGTNAFSPYVVVNYIIRY